MIKAVTRLSRLQRLILAVLFVGDVVVLAAGFFIVNNQPAPIEIAASVALPTATSDTGVLNTGVPKTVDQASFQALGAEQLAVRNLAGTIRLDADGSLRFELTGQDTGGGALARPSEAAWDVLAAAAALPQAGCGLYPFVRVQVPDSNGPPDAQLLVEVNGIDLRAWGERELDDGELSARSKASHLVRPSSAQP
jgi:hypothetical protein